MSRLGLLLLPILLLTASLFTAASAQDLAGVKCIVTGDRGANDKHASKHLDGDVYFCCQRCKSTYDADPKKFATKANHQLVVSGQYVQTRCPSGKKITDNQRKMSVMGVNVIFCDENQMMKVSDASGQQKAEMMFGGDAFAQTFSKLNTVDVSAAKCILMPKRSASEKFSVDHKDAKLFFCCKGCVDKFGQKKDDAEIAARANHQLFATGQYKQKSCPMGGGGVKDDHYTEVGGVKVKYSCPKCKGKIEQMDSDDQLIVKLFSDENFDKTFESTAK